MLHRKAIIFAIFMQLTSCAASVSAIPDETTRGLLSVKMVNLSSAVNAYFSTLSVPPIPGSDGEILIEATKHDRRLLAPEFQPYTLKVQYQNPYAVLLLCDKDNNQAIMEDAGCSARLDRQVRDNKPCDFTLQVKPGCQVEGAD